MIFENLKIWQFLNNLYQRIQFGNDKPTSTLPLLTLWVAQEGTTPVEGVKIQETSTHLFLKVSIPSLRPEDLEIRVTSETIFLAGEQMEQVQVLGYCDFTYPVQQFQCLIPLPYAVHPETVTAEFQGNVLRLTLPKQKNVSPRTQGIVVYCDTNEQRFSQLKEANF
jgi:HSP20 family protein